MGAAFSACFRHHAAPAPSPVLGPDTPEMAVYRTVAESVYVRATRRSLGIVTMLLAPPARDASAAFADPLGTRPLWWATGDSADARAARQALLAMAAHPTTLDGVDRGATLLQSIAPIQPRC